MKAKLIIASLLLTGCASKPVTTNWIGCPVVNQDNRYEWNQGYLPAVKIGLRSDGVVVWEGRKPSYEK